MKYFNENSWVSHPASINIFFWLYLDKSEINMIHFSATPCESGENNVYLHVIK